MKWFLTRHAIAGFLPIWYLMRIISTAGAYVESIGEHRHHKDFNKLNNNPENITRLTKEEHLRVHQAAAEKTLRRPDVLEKLRILRKTPEYRDKIRKTMLSPRMNRILSENAKKQWENKEYKKYMVEKFLAFYASNKEYREKSKEMLTSAQVKYWGDKENRKKQAERVRRYFKENPSQRKVLSVCAILQWGNEKLLAWRSQETKKQWTPEFRIKRKSAYNNTYLAKGLQLLKSLYEKHGVLDEAMYNEERKKLRDRSVIKLSTLTERFFGNDREKLKEAVVNLNHKIVSVVKLDTKTDVYDFEVPGTHNFALASGVFVHNSAKQGRDRRFQAILPLKGKILNVERARLDRILSSSEIRALIIAMGTAIADEFDITKLRYHRVIIMTDADVDGSHIRTLLLTLFYRYFPELIARGHIYIAQPPLYRIQMGKKAEYAYTDQMKDRIIAQFKTAKEESPSKAKSQKTEKVKEGAEEAAEEEKEEGLSFEASAKEEKVKGVSIQRYKGLGEMNAEQLWDTTMNPEKRMMMQVTIADAQEADKIFDILMGAEVGPRKRFIQTHAKNVKNLDI